jgi:hypothetical protein
MTRRSRGTDSMLIANRCQGIYVPAEGEKVRPSNSPPGSASEPVFTKVSVETESGGLGGG